MIPTAILLSIIILASIALGTRDGAEPAEIAVCATGHLRTLILPSMYKALKASLLDPLNVDLFLIGNLMDDSGNSWSNRRWVLQQAELGIVSEGSSEIQAALDFLKPKYYELHVSSCEELQRAWASDGIQNRVCASNGNFIQIMWLDHCIHKVRTDPTKYSVVVRTRPDVGIFDLVSPLTIPSDAVGYMPKDGIHNAKTDFFTIPESMLTTWWDAVAKDYADGFPDQGGLNGFPDLRIFNYTGNKTLVWFPVMIVRGPAETECFRLEKNEDLYFDCRAKAHLAAGLPPPGGPPGAGMPAGAVKGAGKGAGKGKASVGKASESDTNCKAEAHSAPGTG